MNEKNIRYLEIKNCKLTEQYGRPALLAPEDADADRLKWNGFLKMPDGKWIHFLTKSEQKEIENAGQEQTEIVLTQIQSAAVSEKKSRILAGGSAALIAAIFLTIFFGGITGGWLVLILLFLAGALILSIAALINNRDSDFAKYMLGFSVFLVIYLLLWMFVIMTFRSACDSCQEQCHHIPG
ncbi:MAG: hypothetical protein IKQ39_06700 [Oscillospiraceae bacterium]|nr:hypothetical protein [Oscillospiraceae bacterium]